MLPADKALAERLGARLREIRERAKLSQEAVAEKAGFSGKYLGEIEKGVRDVPLSTLRAVAESGLGVRIETLFERSIPRAGQETAPHARDVELTATLLATLPMKIRRPLLTLVEAVANEQNAPRVVRAAEPATPWKRPRRR